VLARLERGASGAWPAWAGPASGVGSTQAVKMRTPQQSYPGSKVGLYGAFMADVEKLKRLSLADRDRLGGQLEQAYTRGASLASLAASHRTSAGRVRLILLERGVVLRRPGGSTRRPDPQRLERAQVDRPRLRGRRHARATGQHPQNRPRDRPQPGSGSRRPDAGARRPHAPPGRTGRRWSHRHGYGLTRAPGGVTSRSTAGDESHGAFSAALEVSMHLWWQHSN